MSQASIALLGDMKSGHLRALLLWYSMETEGIGSRKYISRFSNSVFSG